MDAWWLVAGETVNSVSRLKHWDSREKVLRHRFCNVPAQRFWRETVSLLDVMWPRSNQWECALLGKNFQLYNNYWYLLLTGRYSSKNTYISSMWSRGRSLALLTLFKEEQRKIDNKWNFARNFIGNICFKQKLGISCQGNLFIQAKPDTKEAKKRTFVASWQNSWYKGFIHLASSLFTLYDSCV